MFPINFPQGKPQRSQTPELRNTAAYCLVNRLTKYLKEMNKRRIASSFTLSIIPTISLQNEAGTEGVEKSTEKDTG